MKSRVFFVLLLGAVGLLANPISKQTSEYDNNSQISDTANESQTKHQDVLPNKAKQEQKESSNEIRDMIDENRERDESIIDFVIEENMENEITHLPIEDDDFPVEDPFRDQQVKIEGEIMETAAGFIPTPLVFRRRNKNKPKRRFATRRHFRRNPYRRIHFYHPYYSFSPYSSLGYY